MNDSSQVFFNKSYNLNGDIGRLSVPSETTNRCVQASQDFVVMVTLINKEVNDCGVAMVCFGLRTKTTLRFREKIMK